MGLTRLLGVLEMTTPALYYLLKAFEFCVTSMMLSCNSVTDLRRFHTALSVVMPTQQSPVRESKLQSFHTLLEMLP